MMQETDVCCLPQCGHVRWRHSDNGCVVPGCTCKMIATSFLFKSASYAGPETSDPRYA